jgi:hypothetical protein
MDVAAHPDEPTMCSICVWSNIAFHSIHPTSGKSEVVFNADEHTMNVSVSGSKDHMKLQIVFHRQPMFPKATANGMPQFTQWRLHLSPNCPAPFRACSLDSMLLTVWK